VQTLGNVLVLYLRYTLAVLAVGVVVAAALWAYGSLRPYLERARHDED
jgi:hypothetical protein